MSLFGENCLFRLNFVFLFFFPQCCAYVTAQVSLKYKNYKNIENKMLLPKT